jgi:hypothetical protein
MTFGTYTGHPPDEVTNSTELPVCTGVPIGGIVPATDPLGIVFEHVLGGVTGLKLRPDWTNFDTASTVVKPLTSGRGYFALEERIVRLTTSPVFPIVPAVGV